MKQNTGQTALPSSYSVVYYYLLTGILLFAAVLVMA